MMTLRLQMVFFGQSGSPYRVTPPTCRTVDRQVLVGIKCMSCDFTGNNLMFSSAVQSS